MERTAGSAWERFPKKAATLLPSGRTLWCQFWCQSVLRFAAFYCISLRWA